MGISCPGIQIQLAVNGSEKWIGRYFVDGIVVIDGVEHVWGYQGVFFHGCPSCFEPSAACPPTDAPYQELRRAAAEKIQMLKSVSGVQVSAMR